VSRLIELSTATNKPDEVKKWQAERGNGVIQSFRVIQGCFSAKSVPCSTSKNGRVSGEAVRRGLDSMTSIDVIQGFAEDDSHGVFRKTAETLACQRGRRHSCQASAVGTCMVDSASRDAVDPHRHV
jgi:hypothetical protein